MTIPLVLEDSSKWNMVCSQKIGTKWIVGPRINSSWRFPQSSEVSSQPNHKQVSLLNGVRGILSSLNFKWITVKCRNESFLAKTPFKLTKICICPQCTGVSPPAALDSWPQQRMWLHGMLVGLCKGRCGQDISALGHGMKAWVCWPAWPTAGNFCHF